MVVLVVFIKTLYCRRTSLFGRSVPLATALCDVSDL